MHGNGDGALRAVGYIIGVPGDALRDVGVDAASREECARVLYVCVRRANEENEAENSGRGGLAVSLEHGRWRGDEVGGWE